MKHVLALLAIMVAVSCCKSNCDNSKCNPKKGQMMQKNKSMQPSSED